MRDISRDVRYAARSLIRNPGFATVAIATIMLGIGANTLIFSVVDHVMFRPLPYPDPDRLVTVWPNAGMLRGELQIIQLDNRSFIDVGGYVTSEDVIESTVGDHEDHAESVLVTRRFACAVEIDDSDRHATQRRHLSPGCGLSFGSARGDVVVEGSRVE